MDNVTHTLIGILVAETASRLIPTAKNGIEPAARRTLYIPLLAVGSNLPDIDFIYSAITRNKLDYLLQHRGYTHTLVGALVGAVAMLAACHWWMRRQRIVATRADWTVLVLLALLGPALHLAMDATNSYGVHPFWPIDNHWHYGDSVFIIEPLFWAAAAPLFFLLRSSIARILMGLVLAAGVLLSFMTGLVPTALAIALLVLTAFMLWVGRKGPPKTALIAGVGVWLVVTAMFLVAHRWAMQRTDEIAAQFAPAKMLDAALTPMPVNPWCWELLLVQSNHSTYTLRRAILSLAPTWINAQRCPSRSLGGTPTLPLKDVSMPNTSAVHWYGEAQLNRKQLAAAVAGNCELAAIMRFVRIPWLLRRDAHWLIGDLRFDRDPSLSFAEFEVADKPPVCPHFVPAWRAPREDLLQ